MKQRLITYAKAEDYPISGSMVVVADREVEIPDQEPTEFEKLEARVKELERGLSGNFDR